jgi:hypothetical protein
LVPFDTHGERSKNVQLVGNRYGRIVVATTIRLRQRFSLLNQITDTGIKTVAHRRSAVAPTTGPLETVKCAL